MHGVFSAGEIKLAFHFSSGQLSSRFNKRCWSKQNFAWSPAQTNTQAAYGTNFVLFAQFSQVQGFSQFSCPYLIAPPPSRLALLPIFNFLPLLLLAAFSSVDSRDLRHFIPLHSPETSDFAQSCIAVYRPSWLPASPAVSPHCDLICQDSRYVFACCFFRFVITLLPSLRPFAKHLGNLVAASLESCHVPDYKILLSKSGS